MSRQPDEWTQEETDALGDIVGKLSDTVIRLRAELETARALLRLWCDGFEEIDKGSLCCVYDESQNFFDEEKKKG